jgi:hypothetical protein
MGASSEDFQRTVRHQITKSPNNQITKC